MLHVVFSSQTARLDGAAMGLYALVTGLDRRAFAPLVVLAQDGPLGDLLRAAGIATRLVPFDGLSRMVASRRIAAIARTAEAELLYANGAVSFSRVAAAAAHGLGIPVLWHLHEPPDSRRVARQQPWMRRLAAQVVVESDEQRQALSAEMPVVQVDNGVDLQRFRPQHDGAGFRAAHGLDPDAFVFGCVGALEPRKNQRQFLEAAHALLGEHPGLQFLVVGTGPGAYLQSLIDFVAASPRLHGRVVFTGELLAVEDAYAAMDGLVLPSLWEGFPRVLLEAMASGTPAIASRVGQVALMTEEGRCARLVAPGDGADLLAAMREAVADPSAAAARATLARARVQAHYSSGLNVRVLGRLMSRTARLHPKVNPAPLGVGPA